MGDDVLAERLPPEVAAWYGRLADLIDTKKIDNEKPIAPWALRGWPENATDQAPFGRLTWERALLLKKYFALARSEEATN